MVRVPLCVHMYQVFASFTAATGTRLQVCVQYHRTVLRLARKPFFTKSKIKSFHFHLFLNISYPGGHMYVCTYMYVQLYRDTRVLLPGNIVQKY